MNPKALFDQFFDFFFRFKTYKKGLIIHLTFLVFYSLCFIGVYYYIGYRIHDEQTRAYYQRILGKFQVACMVLHLFVLVAARWNEFKQLVAEYFTEKGSAYNLAIFRIYFFFMLGGYFNYVITASEIAWTYLPRSSRVNLPYIGWLVQNIPISPVIFQNCANVASFLCLLICIGLFTRVALVALVPLAFYVIGVPMFFGKISHSHILLWVPLLMCLSPVSDVLSIDSLLRKRRKSTILIEPGSKYIVPFKLLWLQLAIIYCFAGIIKLWDCGLDWALSDSMVNQMQWEWVENYDKVPDFRIDHFPALAKIGGLCVIYFELLYFLFIIKPSGRVWALIGAFSLHKLAGYFMYIDFANLRQVHFSYINWNKIALSLKGRYKRKENGTKTETRVTDCATAKSKGINKPLYLGAVLISINFIFSTLKIHSYPFSSYPTYSGIVPGEIQTIRVNAINDKGENINVKKMGVQSNFRWENIRPYEQRIAEIAQRKDSTLLKIKLKEYWMLWQNNVKALKSVHKVEMYLETTSIVPERRNQILRSEYLGTVVDTAGTK